MDNIIRQIGLAILICVATIGCNTISYSTLGDNVRKATVYQSDKKIRIVSEKIEMEDPLNYGQWWEAEKTSEGIYAFTVKGLANKQTYEDDQASLGNTDGDGY